MKLTAVLLSFTGFLLLHVPAASAEDFDPALFNNGSACATISWCSSVNLNATDPISGETGVVEYILKTAAQGGSDPSVETGDVDFLNIGYVLRFEMNSGTPDIFILDSPVAAYNMSNGAGANPLSLTGLPDGQQATWKPTDATMVGFDSITTPPTNQIYGFEVVPEPGSIFLLGSGLGLLGLGAIRRKRKT